jgi:hypothetical protein
VKASAAGAARRSRGGQGVCPAMVNAADSVKGAVHPHELTLV